MMRLLWVKTTRVSAVIRAFAIEYAGGTVAIDLVPEPGPLEVWCTNQRLKSARDFSLTSGGVEILAFHDGWKNMWAHESAKPFVDELVAQRLLRYTVETRIEKPSLFARLRARIFGA